MVSEAGSSACREESTMSGHEETSKNVSLVPVNDLLGMKFHVPSYQRGYRWTSSEVGDLLDDILEFHNSSEKGEFYCLQPLVVAASGDQWILIDGQQRLTTIFILLSYFNERLSEAYRKPLYTLNYETRPDSAAYLTNIVEAKRNDNIDYYHVYETKKTVAEWFKDKQNIVNDYESTVLNRVKFIWYETGIEASPVDIFSRLNSGRIPLNNAELIKALFLRRGNFRDKDNSSAYLKQLRIAADWDRIEYRLQEPPFWYFLTDPSQSYSSRIEFVFDLMKSKPLHSDPLYTFHKFNSDMGGNANIEDHWQVVKGYFMTFNEWFTDRELFHFIGFLIETGTGLPGLMSNVRTKSKTQFKAYLRNEIKKKVNYNLDDLDYENDRKAIKTVLLLFNVVTIIANEKSYLRYPFDLYKPEKWDIEHIRSRKSDKPDSAGQRGWLQDMQAYFIGRASADEGRTQYEHLREGEKQLAQRVEQLLGQDKIDENDFTKIYDDLLAHFEERDEPEDINEVSNLALLDARTNRSYKNALFPVKRRTIIEKDMNGTFVPICTKNVFLKSYSSKLEGSPHWHPSDANDYYLAIKTMLAPYLPAPKTEVKNG